MLKMMIATALSLPLCACGDNGSQQQQDVTKVVIANPVSDQLKGGDALYRAIGLRRVIVDSGHHCKSVDAGGFQQPYKNYALWTAHCTDSGDWAVFIAPAGDAEARRCDEMVQLRMPKCGVSPPLQSESAAPRKAPR